jgi:lactoylglutathione lyase
MTTNSFPKPPSNKEGHFSPGGPTPTFNPPPTPPTQNYRLNHLAIRIKYPSPSLHFYVDLLGMRVIFTMNAGPFTIYYLGHPPPGTKAEDLDAWAKKTSEIPVMTRTSGLLELYHVHGTEEVSTGNIPPYLGFAHLGFTVPDVRAAVERLRGDGVTILKDLGVCERGSIPLSKWEEERGVGEGEIHENYAWFFEKFAMVADPVSKMLFAGDEILADISKQDGYSVELIPQEI